MARLLDSEFDLQNHIENISKAKSEQDMFAVCSTIAENLDSSYFSYGLMWADNFHRIKFKIFSNHEKAWTEEYKINSYHLIDPRIKSCMSTITPIYWNTEMDYLKKLSGKAKSMMENAHENNIRSGIMAPFRGFRDTSGAFGVGITSSSHVVSHQKHLKHIAPYVDYLGGFVQQAMIRLLALDDFNYLKSLTEREKDCLCWAADGKTASEIATILYISERTVKFHFGNSMKKLGARNTSQALAIAILKGCIEPEMKRK